MRIAILAATFLVAACTGGLLEVRPTAMPASATMSPFDRAYVEGKQNLMSDRPGLAIVKFEQAVAINPRSVAALNAIGTAYDLLHRPDVARRYYDAALAIEPASADTINNMAVSASIAGNTTLASQLFSRAARLDPRNATITRNLESAGPKKAADLTGPSADFTAGRPQLVRSGLYEFTLMFGGVNSDMLWPGLPNAFSQFGLQCVPFARELSGIRLRGDALYWWEAAAGFYARGGVPEVGSIMSFRPIPIMPLGHLAVVTALLGPRELRIDHANWTHAGDSLDGISRGIAVIDVSERNDWSAVRVEIQHSGAFGNVYPISGFIYNRPSEPRPAEQIPEIPRILAAAASKGTDYRLAGAASHKLN